MVNAADVGVTYRAGHGGMVDTSLDRVEEDVLAGPDGAGVRRHVPDILLADAAGVTVVDVKAPGKRDDPPVRWSPTWVGPPSTPGEGLVPVGGGKFLVPGA